MELQDEEEKKIILILSCLAWEVLEMIYLEKSVKFRTMRENQDHIHTMSRRGYARLASMMEKESSVDTTITRSQVWIEGHKKKNGQPISQAIGAKIKKIEECPPESLNTTNLVDHAISLVFDKESRSRVRGMDVGVKPSKVGAFVEKNEMVKHLEIIVHNLQQEMQEMRSMFLQNISLQNEKEQSQENRRKSSRIEIQQLSRRSRKKGGAPIDDEAIRVENLLKEAVDRHLQDKPEGTQPIEVHEEAFRSWCVA